MRSLIFILAFATSIGYSQQNGLRINYGYGSIPNWNEAISVYNFARPFLTNPQPFLRHSAQLGYSHFGNESENWQYGLDINLTFTTSRAVNEGLTVFLQGWWLDAGVRFRRPIGDKNMFLELAPSISANMLSRSATGIDSENEFISSFGGGLSLEALYVLSFNSGRIDWLSGIRTVPYQWNYKPWRALNESKPEGVNNYSYSITVLTGMRVYFGKTQGNS